VLYISTRGEAPRLPFDDVLLSGLARDGGLYLPDHWPRFDAATLRSFAGKPYAEVAAEVLRPFLPDSVAADVIDRLTERAYARFGHAATCPLVQLDPGTWVQELFHGPTLAFKDLALQLLGELFEHVLAARGERITIIGATSGDTGSAAIEACRGRERIDIVMLHPAGRVSEVQRRQMTTVDAANVHNVALDGTFDDCQAAVKALFADTELREDCGLAAVNSINVARILAQAVYYITAGVALGAPDRPVAFSVPTGNFGNVYAGYMAAQMGLPVERLIVGSNSNDILTRFLDEGAMDARGVVATRSPSMDIQVSSNFERLLFDLLDRDGPAVKTRMARFRETGSLDVPATAWRAARDIFAGARCDDDATLAEIARVHREAGMLVDPHTAIGIAAARDRRPDDSTPVVSLATAHPAKFPDAVEQATGERPALPDRLAGLYDWPEHASELPNDLDTLRAFVRARSRAGAG